MVFAQREKVVSNLARFVMIIWVFVMLILTQSYTASLASLLTVQQLHPIVTDIKDLLRNGDTVGYAENTYVYNVLREVGFDDSKLKDFKSTEDLDALLSKGSANGGIAAAIDETPNMKVFLGKYCSKYTMIGPIFKTDGFAFVFPKRSPLIPDISHAVLSVTEGEKILDFENKWFKKDSNCEDLSAPKVSSYSLGLESFWGLFLVAGVASIIALVIFFASFTYRHRHILVHPDSRASTWGRIRVMLKIFNEKDLDCHTFKSSPPHDSVKASPNNFSESPLSYTTNQTDRNLVFFGEQQTPSTGQASPEVNFEEVSIAFPEA